MAVIYDSPLDLGPGFAVRMWRCDGPEPVPAELVAYCLSSLSTARDLVPDGMVCLGRFPDDDPCIVEVWL